MLDKQFNVTPINKTEQLSNRISLPCIPEIHQEELHNFWQQVLLFHEQSGVTRWGGEDLIEREKQEVDRESLMSHVGSMNIIKRIIKEYATEQDDESLLDLDWDKIDRYIQVHDLVEILYGDKIMKSEQDKKDELDTTDELMALAEKKGMGDWFEESLLSYNSAMIEVNSDNKEALLVKTIDELSGITQMFYARSLERDKRGTQGHIDFFDTYTKEFPSVYDLATYLINLKDHLSEDIEWSRNAGQYELSLDDE